MTTRKRKRGHICYQCDVDIYPIGKPIDDNDKLAELLPDGSGRWTCGEYKIEELNNVNASSWTHAQAFITREGREVERWNQYTRRVNKTMNAGLPYKTNWYIRTSFYQHFAY
jgi:hypothetical protein